MLYWTLALTNSCYHLKCYLVDGVTKYCAIFVWSNAACCYWFQQSV